MLLVVQKFGGTSVADADKIKAAAARAVKAKRLGHQVVMVVSARGKKTDELVGLAAEITETPPAREMDMLLSTGEQESVALMAMAVQTLGEEAISLTGGQIGIVTDSTHTKARIRSISTNRMRQALKEGKIVIAAGFQGTDEDFNITTLGRGGSDTTAVALAAVLQADVCEIYTDVEGVFSTDPRMVEAAQKINRISYDEMLELASLGAGVMHSRSIEFADKFRVPIRVRPAYSDAEGTLVAPEPADHLPVVTGVAFVRDEARVSLSKLPDRPGVMQVVLQKMSERKIPVDMIVQDVGDGGLAEVSFTVPQNDLAETLTAAEAAIEELGAGKVLHGTNLSKVSVVGAGMRRHTGVAAQMFQALCDAEVNIGMITTSEIKISVLVSRDQCEAAVHAVHAGFGLHKEHAQTPPLGQAHAPVTGTATFTNEEWENDVIAKLSSMEDIVVSDVRLDREQSLVTISNIPDTPGIAADLFSANAKADVMVDMIVQNISHSGLAHLSFTVPKAQLQTSLDVTRAVAEKWPTAELNSQDHIAKLTVTGIGLRSHTGVGERMFHALAAANINVQLINTSEVRISTVIDLESGEAAHRAVLEAFGLEG
ncbi:Aspartokinase [Symmachiella macrocystis]|uniref:aspartate kinase n=1 Tax=Symmachiella macrocystis TaxID=2527985 RepID=A0A5C6BBD0_9PLAN|nr:aspartate kinase [Symmachiella macrocystis]TWU08761.1 Aspartokinase [Symmachiella macrocystis]